MTRCPANVQAKCAKIGVIAACPLPFQELTGFLKHPPPTIIVRIIEKLMSLFLNATIFNIYALREVFFKVCVDN